MIRWTCDKCGFSGLYNANPGQQVSCRSCHFTATARSEGRGSNQQVRIGGGTSGLADRIRGAGIRPIHAISLILVLAGGLGVYVYATRPDALPPGVVGNVNDPQVAHAVGMVVATIQSTLPNGRILDMPVASGSCFLISPTGIALTNRHVVQGLRDFEQAPIKSKLEGEQNVRLAMKFYVFIKDQQYDARILDTGETQDDDYAILKIPVPVPSPYFRLCSLSEVPQRGASVMALGYPGIAQAPVSVQEGTEDAVRKFISATVGSRLRQQLKSRDFEYVQTTGSTSRAFRDGTRMWVEHDAAMHHGSSGGPLLTTDCRVIGINTKGQGPVVQDGSGSTGFAPILNYALVCDTFRDSIVKYAPGAMFR